QQPLADPIEEQPGSRDEERQDDAYQRDDVAELNHSVRSLRRLIDGRDDAGREEEQQRREQHGEQEVDQQIPSEKRSGPLHGLILYPMPRIVSTISGAPGSSSSFSRRWRMWTMSVLSPSR